MGAWQRNELHRRTGYRVSISRNVVPPVRNLDQCIRKILHRGHDQIRLMRDTASVDAAAEATFSAFGKVHILCNNAGVGARGGIDHIALDNWRWVLDVNLMGVVNGVRAFLPHLRAHGEGSHIVNTASMAGVVSSHQGFAPYPASKYAVVGMSVRGAGCRVEAFWDWREHIVSGNRPHKYPGKRPQSPPTLWAADTRGHVKPTLCSICRTRPHWHGPCGGGTPSRGCYSQ